MIADFQLEKRSAFSHQPSAFSHEQSAVSGGPAVRAIFSCRWLQQLPCQLGHGCTTLDGLSLQIAEYGVRDDQSRLHMENHTNGDVENVKN
jgi:hypothetical protein